jgi:thioredoxin reductase
MTTESLDVVIIGGGTAGLSGALTLARARRSVVVVDAGEPRNAPAAAVHGYLTRDGTPPQELLQLAREEVLGYGAELVDGRVAAAEPDGDGFLVTLADGTDLRARRLLVATGLIDELPAIPGLRERWGRDVVHCPYCHGWEIRDAAIAVIGTNEHAVHQALLFRQWSADLTLVLHTAPEPTAEQAEQLAARDASVVREEVVTVETSDDRLTGVRLASGETVPCDAIALLPRFVARTAGLERLGLATPAHPMGVGVQIEADAMGLTNVPGVYAAGNARDLTASVVTAADNGVRAAAALNADLIAEDARLSVARGSAGA